MQPPDSRISSHYVTLMAIYVGALVYLAALIGEMLGYPANEIVGQNSFYVKHSSAILGSLVFFLTLMAYLYQRGHKFAVNCAIMAMTLSVPFIFDRQAFLDDSIPNGIWLPFIFALVVSRFRVALVTLVTSLGLAVLSYPGAFQSTNAMSELLMTVALLMLGRFIWRQILNENIVCGKEKIVELAYFDQLTGLPNRTLLLDRLNQVISISARSGVYSALLFLDLDHFKNINDTYGHQKGDLLLKQVADSLLHRIREGDTASRFGGDEFVVLLTELGVDAEVAANKANAVALKLLEVLNQTYQLGDVVYRSSASIGVTMFNGRSSTLEELLKQADMAMYKSKKAGKNTLRFFDPTLEFAMQHHATMEKDLRIAIDRGQFILHYQGQYTDTSKITGAEVLLRWEHPEQGLISPALFISFAEETGLILPIGNWVLESACQQLVLWEKAPDKRDLVLSVNVSELQLKQPDFVDTVLDIIQRTGANPHRLKLEVKESMLVHHVDDTIQKMLVLKKHGIRFSLDDFGTGYSSLSSLKLIPLDQLKIDSSFVHDVHSDCAGTAMAQTIVILGNSLGLHVIAEGVETEAQRCFLVEAGCVSYQGYLFSHPLAVHEFERLVERNTDDQRQLLNTP